jgi:hypothetical protein
VALTNHPTDEILKVTLEAESQEAETLDSTADSGDNDSVQLNSQTDDDAPSKTQTLISDMQVTSDHPVYVEGQGWLWAENLSIGDRLRRADGGYARVLAIERIELAEPEPVYNFTVKGPHTYFVLEVGVLVHNDRPDCGLFEGYEPEPGKGGFEYKKRTVKKVPLFEENIPDTPTGVKNAVGKDWEVKESWGITDEAGAKTLLSQIKGPDGTTGLFKRAYDPSKKQLIFKAGFGRDLPTWVQHAFAMSSKGTPTGTFFTIYQMKRLGIPEGAIRQVKMDTIVNNKTILQLKWLQNQFPDKSLDELLQYTHSVSYAKTVLTQTGYKIVPGSFKINHIDNTISPQTLRRGMEPEEMAAFNELMRELDIKENDKLFYAFDIEFEVEPVR